MSIFNYKVTAYSPFYCKFLTFTKIRKIC